MNNSKNDLLQQSLKSYWLVIGTQENLQTSLKIGVWGLPSLYNRSLEKMHVGDIILFYAKNPIKGVIGYGVITSKNGESKPIFSEEIELGSVFYPLRISFGSTISLPENQWMTKSVRPPKEIPLRNGLQHLKDGVALKIISDLG